MKKLLKIIGVLFLVLIIGAFILFKVYDKPLPAGQSGAEADELAQKMLKAVNVAAWDTLPFVKWSFRGQNHYVWDKFNDKATIEFGETKVEMNLKVKSGTALVNGREILDPDAKAKIMEKAWSNWCNDSFWLCAPSKAFDPGTEREVVKLDNGSEGLLVKYTSGGVTPGDKYLWELDENGRPVAWQMWTQILKVGGLRTTWEDWEQLPGGAWIAKTHKMGSMNVDISNLAGANTLEELK